MPFHLTLGPRGGLRAGHVALFNWLRREYFVEYSVEYSMEYFQNILWNILFLIKIYFFQSQILTIFNWNWRTSNLNIFCIRRRIWVPFTALGSYWRALSSRSVSDQFWVTSFLTILRHLVLSSWSHLPNEKAFGPQKLTKSLIWTVQHLRNRNILFQSAKRAY